MLTESTYKAASAVAAIAERHFSSLLEEALHGGEKDLAAAPTAGQIEMMLDTAFWASLRREEGNSPKISLAFLSPDQAGYPLCFESRLAFNAGVLLNLVPEKNGLVFIWGYGLMKTECMFGEQPIRYPIIVLFSMFLSRVCSLSSTEE